MTAVARDLDPAWGRQVVDDLRGRLGRDPNPAEVVREAMRRSSRAGRQGNLFEAPRRSREERRQS